MKMRTLNRKRNRAITVRMNDSEMEILNNKLKKTGITQQAFVIGAIKQAVILPVEGLRTLKEIVSSEAWRTISTSWRIGRT